MLNTLQLCGIEHTCSRGTKILATAEAQMEPLKAPCSASSCSCWLGYKASGGATMLLPHLFINSPLRSVQDYAISCTECLLLLVRYRICPFSVRNTHALQFPSRFGPSTCLFSGNLACSEQVCSLNLLVLRESCLFRAGLAP